MSGDVSGVLNESESGAQGFAGRAAFFTAHKNPFIVGTMRFSQGRGDMNIQYSMAYATNQAVHRRLGMGGHNLEHSQNGYNLTLPY